MSKSPEEELQVSMPDVTRFVRQLSHDLRNHLNAAELQSTYLGEIAEDAELKEEVKRLRAMLAEMSTSLQRVTGLLAAIKLTLMPYAAVEFMEDLRHQVGTQFPEESKQIEWSIEPGKAMLNVDPQVLQPALVELFANAFQHGRGDGSLRASAKIAGSDFVFTLVEPKSTFNGQAELWGRQPFAHVKHGHYALGLLRTRTIIEAHHGQLYAAYDSAGALLVTTVVLPLGEQE